MLGFRHSSLRAEPGETRNDNLLEALQVRASTPAIANPRSPEEALAVPNVRVLGPLPLSLDTISSPEQFDAISVAASDIVKNGRVVKFLIDRRRPDTLRVHFINGNYERDGKRPDSSRYSIICLFLKNKVPELLDIGKLACMKAVNARNNHIDLHNMKLYMS